MRLQQAVQATRALLHDRLGEGVSLAALAEAMGVSPFHLRRAFRAATGLPPHAYRLQLRIARARKPLLAGLPLPDIAASLGFADQSHFGRHFKRAVSVTPRRYIWGMRGN